MIVVDELLVLGENVVPGKTGDVFPEIRQSAVVGADGRQTVFRELIYNIKILVHPVHVAQCFVVGIFVVGAFVGIETGLGIGLHLGVVFLIILKPRRFEGGFQARITVVGFLQPDDFVRHFIPVVVVQILDVVSSLVGIEFVPVKIDGVVAHQTLVSSAHVELFQSAEKVDPFQTCPAVVGGVDMAFDHGHGTVHIAGTQHAQHVGVCGVVVIFTELVLVDVVGIPVSGDEHQARVRGVFRHGIG